jgi:hypothetical protein
MESSGSEKLHGKGTKWSWEIPLSPATTLLLQILPHWKSWLLVNADSFTQLTYQQLDKDCSMSLKIAI